MLITFFVFTLPNAVMAANGDIGSSDLAKGTEKLLKDATTWLMIIVPLVTVLVVIYYLIRRAAADEMDHKKWNSRITTAVISCIVAVAASALLNMLTAYFGS